MLSISMLPLERHQKSYYITNNNTNHNNYINYSIYNSHYELLIRITTKLLLRYLTLFLFIA